MNANILINFKIIINSLYIHSSTKKDSYNYQSMYTTYKQKSARGVILSGPHIYLIKKHLINIKISNHTKSNATPHPNFLTDIFNLSHHLKQLPVTDLYVHHFLYTHDSFWTLHSSRKTFIQLSHSSDLIHSSRDKIISTRSIDRKKHHSFHSTVLGWYL